MKISFDILTPLTVSTLLTILLIGFIPQSTHACSNNISRGSEGTDVTCLQTYLRLTGDFTYPETTEYFGVITEQAVQRFQIRNNIVTTGTPATTGFGSFGPTTRLALLTEILSILQARLSELLASQNQGSSVSSGGSNSSSGGGGSSSSNQDTVSDSGDSSPVTPEETTPEVDADIPPEPPELNLDFSVTQSRFPTNLFFNEEEYITGTIEGMHAEITPWALNDGGDDTHFFVSTQSTYLCEYADGNLFDLSQEVRLFDSGTCSKREKPGISFETYELYPLWKRDYSGVMSAQLIDSDTLTKTLYTFNHNEHKHNTGKRAPEAHKDTCTAAADIGYGQTECTGTGGDFAASYNAGISMSTMQWTNYNQTNPTEFRNLGPVVWPANGYVEPNDEGDGMMKATNAGVRQPSSIIHDDYMYVFYRDTSLGLESDGRGTGIKVARAQITDRGRINQYSFRTYFNGQWTDSALPPGFTLNNYEDYYSEQGGRSSHLFSDVQPTFSVAAHATGRERFDERNVIIPITGFSVAKVKGEDLFLGVEYRLGDGVYMRISRDLVNWSDGQFIPGSEQPDGRLSDTPLFYPRLLNKEGNNHNLVDAHQFYIVGIQLTEHGDGQAKIMNAVELELNL